MNIRITVEYDGTHFRGWQRQGELPTIQSLLEDCLEQTVGKKVVVYGSSRTDSGVHARAQVANFYVDPSCPVPPDRWHLALNRLLPPTIRVTSARIASDTFHSQKKVRSKIYEYRILNRPHASALDPRVYFFPRPLQWERIREVLPLFVGYKDFKAFQGAKATVKTTERTLMRFDLFEEPDLLFRFELEGSGFLKQMVRTLIGTVVEIGQGLRDSASIEELFRSLDRRQAGRTAPASGLSLIRVNYHESQDN